jgi:hypothetical protein
LSLDPSRPQRAQRDQKKEALQQGFSKGYRRIRDRQRRLATHAANAAGVHDVDQIPHMLNARHVPNRFLHELL